MARTFVIGDIHGALKALKQVIQKLHIQKDDTLIFLGDYVDGWPESAQVIDYLLKLEEQHHCIFIKGNHDAWCEEWLHGEPANPTWMMHGGAASVKSYDRITPQRKNIHLEFYNRMQDYYIDVDNRLFIHAGFTSMHGPSRESAGRNCYWDRTLWEMAIALDKRLKKDSMCYPKRLLLFHEIYIGHTPTLNYGTDTPMQAANVWNVDTGAAFYGKITALDIDTKEFLQSGPVREYYPGERGRNPD